MTGKVLRCAIYTRKSTEEGLEQDFNSLHAQRQACEAYVLSQAGEGWTALAELYDDGGYSGGSMERPALRHLLDDISRGLIDVVVVYKVDRLTRSLADFAKIVERFDGKGVSFVSVTQAFNTTSSMGRLTLNVLLSFAQFEREVTGERIRDKIAASKAKGMWMGGLPPLGYSPDGRTLKIEESEASTVRDIFRRYLELESVHALRDDLAAQGVASQVRVTKRGNTRGGVPFGRGALFHLLSNRIYLGQIEHKGQVHPGLHPPIIDQATFDAVQLKLAASAAGRPLRKDCPDPARLCRRVWDDAGHPMTPVATAKGSRRYRYYVSSALLRGAPREAGSLPRVPAGELEALIKDRGMTLGFSRVQENPWPELLSRLERVTVGEHRIQMQWKLLGHSQTARSVARIPLPPTDTLAVENDVLVLEVEVALLSRGGTKAILGPQGQSAIEKPRTPNAALVKALVRAEAFKSRLLSREAISMAALAKEERIRACYLQRLLRLSFLAPAIKRAILEGTEPATLTLQRLMDRGVEDLWAEQIPALGS